MSSFFISSFSLTQSMRLSVQRIQAALDKAQTEVTSGQVADVGLALGSRTGDVMANLRDRGHYQALIDANGVVFTRMQSSQAALDSVSAAAESLRSTLLTVASGTIGKDAVATQARNAMQALISALGTAVGGQALFSGLNTGGAPLTDYDATPPSAAKVAVDGAFATTFGIPQTDPGVQSISPGAMATFLSGDFAALFEPPQWQTAWSSASDEAITSRIGPSETAVTSVSANAPAIRKLAMAYTMLADLGLPGMKDSTAQTVIDAATQSLNEAIQGVTNMRSDLGAAQSRLTSATDGLKTRQSILDAATGNLVGVDPFEAAARVNDLRTQLETAYALTARLQNLNLVAYL